MIGSNLETAVTTPLSYQPATPSARSGPQPCWTPASTTAPQEYGNTGLEAPRSRTAKRHQLYLKWLIQSIMLFDLGSVITLWLLPSILD